MKLLSPAKHPLTSIVTDTFCLRLILAMLYRAGLDAMDETSPYAREAQGFLNGEFALLALQVLQSGSSRDIDLGDTSDYLSHYKSASNHRKLQARSSNKKRCHTRWFFNG